MEHPIPCRLTGLVIDEGGDEQAIFLHERAGGRRLAIAIGQVEAAAIDRVLHGAPFSRPLTHDLASAAVAALGGSIAGMRILAVREGVYLAELVLRRHDGVEVAIDCRPSDAIALVAGLPEAFIEVEDALLGRPGG